MLMVTTSWDDGDLSDTKVAGILSRYKAKGTFYITKRYRENRLSENQIRALSLEHEIGAHTLTHPNLTALSQEKDFEEIQGSKTWLEGIVGREVSLFCYPFGLYNATVASLVQKAGYRGARTTAHSHTELPTSAYEMPTTLHIYPFPFRKNVSGGYYWGRLLQPFFERYQGYRTLGVPWWKMYSWLSAAKAAFDYGYKQGGVFHLWGHSWELERYGMWNDLESFLRYISSKQNVRFVTNGELLEMSKNKV
jgi:peptidoglycan/xylan/chitin deacetylase (PgdA/CDA1 family)